MGTGPTPRKYPTRLGGRDVAALAIHTQRSAEVDTVARAPVQS